MLQVHTYLNTYAAARRASLPSRDLERVNQLYRAASDVKLGDAKQGGDADLDRSVVMAYVLCRELCVPA